MNICSFMDWQRFGEEVKGDYFSCQITLENDKHSYTAKPAPIKNIIDFN